MTVHKFTPTKPTQHTRTPAEIVRAVAVETVKWWQTHEERDALHACADAWDREQARAQQTCGTCRKWRNFPS